MSTHDEKVRLKIRLAEEKKPGWNGWRPTAQRRQRNVPGLNGSFVAAINCLKKTEMMEKYLRRKGYLTDFTGNQEKIDGKRQKRVDICYSTVGLWTAPEPETLEQEYMACNQAMRKRKKRTAMPSQWRNFFAGYRRVALPYEVPPSGEFFALLKRVKATA